MIIQLFLSALLTAVALLVALQATTSRLMRAVILGVIAAGVFFVWSPERTNAIAHAMGVGRGADLVLYLWVVLTFAVILVLYLKVVRMGRTLTRLAREVALAGAKDPEREQARP